ncbi:hypothetical protein BSKO_12554 [Bryopsis sp. KO-2023]|nr:hypothetical protein BSKO_12554 [Bryopsis sp. KO-2023]
MTSTRILLVACVFAALAFANGFPAGGRKLNACKKQDCDGHKEKFNCDAAAWDDNECECQCLVAGKASKLHDCGDWRTSSINRPTGADRTPFLLWLQRAIP